MDPYLSSRPPQEKRERLKTLKEENINTKTDTSFAQTSGGAGARVPLILTENTSKEY